MEKQLAGTCSSDPLLYNSRNETCSEQSMNGSNGFLLRDFRHVFFFSQFIMGIGGAPLYTLGPAYIDDNVSNKMQPIYTGFKPLVFLLNTLPKKFYVKIFRNHVCQCGFWSSIGLYCRWTALANLRGYSSSPCQRVKIS